MVRNLKIKTFLILSFTFVLVLLSALGASSIYYTQRLANQTIVFYEKPHKIQLEVSKIQTIVSDIGSYIRAALIYQTPDKTQEVTDFISASLDDMYSRIKTVKDLYEGDEQTLLAADAAVQDWLAANDKIRVQMEKRYYSEAIRIYKESYLALENTMTEKVGAISNSADQMTLDYYHAAQRSKVISFWVVLSTVLLTILLTVIICSRILKSIAIPLRQIREAADAMSRGDLHHNIAFSGSNEFGQLAQSMRNTSDTLASYVENIDYVLGRISDNDMTVTVDMDYVGDFQSIKTSLAQIVSFLNRTMIQIGECSDQVAGGAEQVSSSSQILSQGAAEQAGSIEELSASIAEITGQVKRNAQYTLETNDLVAHVGSELESGNQQMGQMLDAITEINSASDQIAKIIKTIEDIAFQTNILALNAAVEAARAGAAGKGFAVVADEVRNLAGKSAEAAKSTTALIQNSITAVQHGTSIADSTAKTLSSVVSGAEQISVMMEKISSASDEQANSISQISDAVSQISQVVQTNSATAEESAAASEEMSGQAQVLDKLVRKFRLKDDHSVNLTYSGIQ